MERPFSSWEYGLFLYIVENPDVQATITAVISREKIRTGSISMSFQSNV